MRGKTLEYLENKITNMATNQKLRTREEIEQEIKSCIRSLHEQYNDVDARNFFQGRISSLEWVLGNE